MKHIVLQKPVQVDVTSTTPSVGGRWRTHMWFTDTEEVTLPKGTKVDELPGGVFATLPAGDRIQLRTTQKTLGALGLHGESCLPELAEAFQIDRILAESRIADLEKAFSELPVDSVPELVRLKEEFATIKEEITAGDWGRIGVIAGMLWYKLDTVISNLSTAVNALRNIERNTSKIK